MLEFIKSAAKKMLIDFEDTSIIDHKLTKGQARESIIIKEFLEPYLPKRYSIDSGVIIDVQSQQSKQQDIVIYDEFYSPLLKDIASVKLFFPESVFSVIESKSVLNKAGTEDMFKKSQSVWNLTSTFKPKLTIAPNFIIDSARPPVLCLGIAFTSSKTLEKLRDDLRDIEKDTNTVNALSAICVLKDKSKRAGIILHVSEMGLKAIDIIPTINSRLAFLEFDEPGGALLYTYLIIMEHLRAFGIVSPGPDYTKYAEMAGLIKTKLTIAIEDAEGAKMAGMGRLIDVDSAMFMKEKTEKLFSKGLDDEEIIEYFYHMIQVAGKDTVLNNTAFTIEDKILGFASPIRLYEAIIRYKSDKATEDDLDIINTYRGIIRAVGRKEITLSIRG